MNFPTKTFSIFALFFTLFIITSCTQFNQTHRVSYNSNTSEKKLFVIDENDIEQFIVSLIPKNSSWKITIKNNTYPFGWNGDSKCKYIEFINPTEKHPENTTGCPACIDNANCDDNCIPPAYHHFWFCANNWIGTCDSESFDCNKNLRGKTLSASKLLCTGKYVIYHTSNGNNSLDALAEKIKIQFCSTSLNSQPTQ